MRSPPVMNIDPKIAGERFAERLHKLLDKDDAPTRSDGSGKVYRASVMVEVAHMVGLDPTSTVLRMLRCPQTMPSAEREKLYDQAMSAAFDRYNAITEQMIKDEDEPIVELPAKVSQVMQNNRKLYRAELGPCMSEAPTRREALYGLANAITYYMGHSAPKEIAT